ncbi:hypothetical protein D9756_007861 [Leucocoprinus leucothites]|uniref:Uncharacterized protein n=1 Tax=Leucocoprinus leucothites TaxID=201217 RepID=A0A8H5D603_9AGAR|nr:hypothetical protein D9756_007861 [Leucoagaricus leucothites]
MDRLSILERISALRLRRRIAIDIHKVPLIATHGPGTFAFLPYGQVVKYGTSLLLKSHALSLSIWSSQQALLQCIMILSCLTIILLSILLAHSTSPQSSPPDACFESTQTLEDLVDCFEVHTVRENFYDEDSYTAAQPTNSQRGAWSQAVSTLLHTNNNCSSTIVPPIIQDIYTAAPFTDVDGEQFCVLYEKTVSPSSNFFEKGWGFMIVPSSQDAVARHIHLAGPHPFSDGTTSAQATQSFKGSRAKSVLIPGRVRTAFGAPSSCIMGTATTTYWLTDVAHNDLEPFFDANVAIWNWQVQRGGCPPASCAFIQFHGKADASCPNDTVFLSTGLANNTWYTDDVDRPVKRLKEQLLLAFNSPGGPNATSPITASLPSDSTCSLVATKNVVARYLNNLPTVASHNVCIDNSDPDTTDGVFIHAEQYWPMRAPISREAWIETLSNTFTVVGK